MDVVVWEPEGGSSSTTLAEALDCDETITTGGDANWGISNTPYYGSKTTRSGSPSDNLYRLKH